MGEDNFCYTITNIEKNDDGNITRASVSWNKEKKGYRLPTEAEWEMAARGGVKGGWDFAYSGSNDIEEVAWYCDNSGYETHNVGTKQENMAGLYDMSGNVWEWCWNTWCEGWSFRILRGGSYYIYDGGSGCAVSLHGTSNNPDFRFSFLGFRICRGL